MTVIFLPLQPKLWGNAVDSTEIRHGWKNECLSSSNLRHGRSVKILETSIPSISSGSHFRMGSTRLDRLFHKQTYFNCQGRMGYILYLMSGLPQDVAEDSIFAEFQRENAVLSVLPWSAEIATKNIQGCHPARCFTGAFGALSVRRLGKESNLVR